jgi:hypothetical protein
MQNDNIEVPKDSSKLQFMSLCSFMHQLGYTYYTGQFWTACGTGAEVIRFNTAVRLYNCDWEYVSKEKALYIPGFHHYYREKSPFCVDGILLRKAIASKILEKVTLQANKQGVVKTQNHWVKFAHNDAYILYKGVLV